MKVESYGPKEAPKDVTVSAAQAEKPVIIFLHGFPGIRSKQNREIAEKVTNETGLRSMVVLYGGLGHAPGVFTFETCLEQVRGFVAGLREAGVPSAILVGHSWGGYLSLVLAAENPGWVRKLVLMSPLVQFATPLLARPWFEETLKTNAHLSWRTVDEMIQQFTRVSQERPPQRLIKELDRDLPVLYLQAKEDPLTPAEYARAVQSDLPKSTRFELVDNDHSFLDNRSELSSHIAQFILES